MHQIVFASRNPNKAREIQRLAGTRFKIICLEDLPQVAGIPQAKETGKCFLENAIIKANYWFDKLGIPVLAEDSGLQIDALDGYPGVNTKRCIQELKPGLDVDVDQPEEVYPLLLELMEQSGNPSTKAHWISSMVFQSSQKTITTQYCVDGNMCPCSGKRVFGFDQYFKTEGYNQTLSELSEEEKDAISPRAQCFTSIFSALANNKKL